MTSTINALTGERVRLRELREEDLADLVSWWQDPDVMVTQTSGPFHPRPADAIAEQFRSWNRNAGTDAGLTVVNRAEGTVIGHVALFGAEAHNRTATFAIIIGPPFQGQGYGTEATRLMVGYGFTELGLHRIQLAATGFNERALHTYEKVGFVEEGRDRQAIFRGGKWHDQVRMGILDHEWWAANPA
ncbi:GNAT family N-acetyltransferase [Paractinoplanes globisporus]|uniref:GNAT family N-acetyltransferase n=1 Tax=Paractinoplanes globisporus TaxID=113565 RepID=A0ABW6WKF9_9ACTN|nr:GNAT family protein [Actinoplanes globisporus]